MATCFAPSSRTCFASRFAPPIHSTVRTSPLTRFRPRVEALEARDVPALYIWSGAISSDPANAGNWMTMPQTPGLPDGDDQLLFAATAWTDPVTGHSRNCVGLTSATDSFAQVSITPGYTGTVSLGASLTFGNFYLSGGAIAQPTSATDLTVTGTFQWIGGILNSTPSSATVNINGGGSITLPGEGNTLTAGSMLSFGSADGNEKTTTITGGGSLFLNGTNPDGIKVGANAAPRLEVDPNDKSWIRSTDGKRLIILEGSKGWTYFGSGEQETDLRIDNQGGLFKLDGTVHIKLTGGSGGATPIPTYSQADSANAKLHINNGSNLEVSHGATINGGSIYLIMNASSSTATLTGNLTMKKGDIVFSGPIASGGATTYGKFKVVGDVTWSGGTYRPCLDTDGTKCNLWEVTGTLTVDMSDINPANRPLIDPALAPGQQYTGTWTVIEATGLGSIQGGNPRIPLDWNLTPFIDGTGVKRKFLLNK